MAVLHFSLSPEASARVYELLVCLAKFGESVSIEARSEKLTLTALNLSRTAYASFALEAKTFFIRYEFNTSGTGKGSDRFTCQLLNKALQSVFRGRANESRGRESTIEQCDATVQDQPDKTQCRLVFKLLCKHGMTKVYRLNYESAEVMHALFDRTAASQSWRIPSRVLREYIEFFGPKTEQLDMLAQETKAVFTSFTEKIQDGKEVLKQPLETAIAIHTGDFEDFHMQQDMHIVISVRDFKAVVTHAETMGGSLSAYFSYPTRPLQFSYRNFGIVCEFTLMTTGDHRGASSTPNPKFISTRSSSMQPSVAPPSNPSRIASEMPPPSRPGTTKPFSSQSQRPSLRAQVRQPSVTVSDPDPESLFVPVGDDDRTWDPPKFNNDEGEEMLGWDASMENPSDSFHQTFRDSISAARSTPPRHQQHQHQHQQVDVASESQDWLEPTQRLSQLHGMFD